MAPLLSDDAASPLPVSHVIVGQEFDETVVMGGRNLGVKECPPAARAVSILHGLQFGGVARIWLEPDSADRLVPLPVRGDRAEVGVEHGEDVRVWVKFRLEEFPDLDPDIGANVL